MASSSKSRSVRTRHIRVGVLSAIASLTACAPLPIDTRSLFAVVTYPKPTLSDGSTSPSSARTLEELNLQVFAALELEAVMAYRDPAKMAACLRALDARDIEDLGNQLIHTGGGWADVARQMKLKSPCDETGDSLALVQIRNRARRRDDRLHGELRGDDGRAPPPQCLRASAERAQSDREHRRQYNAEDGGDRGRSGPRSQRRRCERRVFCRFHVRAPIASRASLACRG
jgi:hypothetical protein